MVEKWYGENYQQGLSIVEIAKRVRNFANNKIKEGKLPQGTKFSIRSDKFSMGRAIDMEIVDYPKEMFFYDPKACIFESNEAKINATNDINNFRCTKLHPDIKSEFDSVEKYAQSYNYDGSDIMTDFFDVNFYGGTMEIKYPFRNTEHIKAMQCFKNGQYSENLCSPLINLHNKSKEKLMQISKSSPMQKIETPKKEQKNSVGKLELALQNVIKEVGFKSTVGSGMCICYGGAKKCGKLSALWSDDAYKVLQKNNFNIKNSKDLIDLNIKDSIASFKQLELRGGYVLCDPKL